MSRIKNNKSVTIAKLYSVPPFYTEVYSIIRVITVVLNGDAVQYACGNFNKCGTKEPSNSSITNLCGNDVTCITLIK